MIYFIYCILYFTFCLPKDLIYILFLFFEGEKGSLHHLNVDINDPSSMEKVMEQIKKLSAQGKDSDAGKKDKKDEL